MIKYLTIILFFGLSSTFYAQEVQEQDSLQAPALLQKKKPVKKIYDGDGVLVVALADWQIGKSDGDGLEGTIGRVLEAREGVIQRVKELRRVGRPISKLIVLWTGDSIEGCMGHYATQTFSVELIGENVVSFHGC